MNSRVALYFTCDLNHPLKFDWKTDRHERKTDQHYKIKWLSKPLQFWNITGPFLANWRFMLQVQRTAPVNFLVTWQWTLTFLLSSLMRFSQVHQVLLDWNCYFSSLFMIKFLLQCFFITFLQYWYSLRIAWINLWAAFLLLKTTIGLVFFNNDEHS